MATNYPDALDTSTELPSNRTDSTPSATNHAEDHNDLAAAVVAIEAELGTNPAGAAATVKARLDAVASESVGFTILKRSSDLSVRDLSAVGDGTDETAELQAAIDTAADEDRPLRWPSPDNTEYVVSDALVVSKRGLEMTGDSRELTRIRQSAVNKHLFNLTGDATDPEVPGTLAGFRLRRMILDGPGKDATTGAAIHTPEDLGSAYFGNFLGLTDVRIQDFDRGIALNHVDNSSWERVNVRYCKTGVEIKGNANTVHGIATTTAQCDTGWSLLDGHGSVQILGDQGSNDRSVYVGDQGRWTLIGGNFENCTGTEFIYIDGIGYLVSIHQRFLKAGGNDVPAYHVTPSGNLVAIEPQYDSFLTRKAIYRATAAANVKVIQSRSATPILIDENGTTSYPAGPFHTRNENSILTAAAALRGEILPVLARDSANTVDKFSVVVRDRNSGSDAYQTHLLSGTIEGTGSPEGVVAAPKGTRYVRTDGGVGTTFYVKEAGTGNTGWTPATFGTGPAGPAGANQDSLNAALGLITSNFGIGGCSSAGQPTAGTIYGGSLGLLDGQIVTYIDVALGVAAAGSVPTMVKLGLADAAGTILALTADEKANAAWLTAGPVRIPLTAPYEILADGGYIPVFLQVGSWGTTQLQLGRRVSAANALATPLGSGMRAFATYGGSKTDLPAVSAALVTPGVHTSDYWFGVS